VFLSFVVNYFFTTEGTNGTKVTQLKKACINQLPKPSEIDF